MNLVQCPHCNSQRILAARVPKGVVVVMPCPACGELVVLFRKKAVALSREILEHGSLDERKTHLAGVIAEFLDSNMFGLGMDKLGFGQDASEDEDDDESLAAADDEGGENDPGIPISQHEVEQFAEIELTNLDDPEYFRKHFG